VLNAETAVRAGTTWCIRRTIAGVGLSKLKNEPAITVLRKSTPVSALNASCGVLRPDC